MHKQFYINMYGRTEGRMDNRQILILSIKDGQQTNSYFIYKGWTTDKFLFYLYKSYLF